ERMRQVLAEGTTLVFVSHDLATMEATCARGMWLREGLLVQDGPVREVLGGYREWVEQFAEMLEAGDGPIKVAKVDVHGADGGSAHSFESAHIDLALESDR